MVDSNGCANNDTIYITVINLDTTEISVSICEGEAFTWQGAEYTTTGTYFAEYTTINGCDSIYKLNLVVNRI